MSYHYKFARGVKRGIFRLSWQGFGLIEAIVVLMVSMNLISMASKYIGQQADSALNHTTAQQLQQLTLAANHYAHDHFEQLQYKTNGGQSVEWEWSDIQNYLQKSGYFPVTFRELNPYQQNYRIITRQPEPQLLQILILTEAGQAIKESSLRQIMQFAGPQSGFISDLQPDQLTGSQGGWELPLTNGLKAFPGHIAALNYLKANEVLSASSLLFRKKIEGHDEYNKMETNLKMAANIELEDGKKIWFNQKGNRTTVIENSKISLMQGKKSVTLEPGKIEVNTADTNYRGDDYRIFTPAPPAIVTNGDMKAGRDMEAGRNMRADWVYAKWNVNVGKEVIANDFMELKDKGKYKAENEVEVGGKVMRNIANIPIYKVDDMYDHIDVWDATYEHCTKYSQRLFMIRDHGDARHLMMCIPSPRTEYTYWVVATGYHDWGQGELKKQRP